MFNCSCFKMDKSFALIYNLLVWVFYWWKGSLACCLAFGITLHKYFKCLLELLVESWCHNNIWLQNLTTNHQNILATSQWSLNGHLSLLVEINVSGHGLDRGPVVLSLKTFKLSWHRVITHVLIWYFLHVLYGTNYGDEAFLSGNHMKMLYLDLSELLSSSKTP